MRTEVQRKRTINDFLNHRILIHPALKFVKKGFFPGLFSGVIIRGKQVFEESF